jgi:diguanylate cyclase (GGDEF)-like protein
VWSQLKDVAALQQKPIIFITDDAKEDWWLKHEGKTIGPKPELIHEMQADAQVDFHMYSSDRFIDRAQAELGIEGRQAVKEVKWIVADRSREWHRHPEYDLLTGLMDRRILSSALQQAIEQWNFSGEPCTLLLMDVDALKFINDVHGHAVGDSVIRYLAEQIKEVVTREGDTAARVGGDEFAVLLNNASDEQGVAVALRIRELLDTPLQTTGRLSVSIGVASCPAHATSVETLYSAAEAAVRYAKHEGGNHIVVSPFKKIA